MAQSKPFDEMIAGGLVAETGSGLFDNLPEPPGDFAQGVKAGVAGVKAAGGGLASLAGRALGVRSLEETGNQITADANEQAALYSRTYKDVDSVGGAVDFAQYALGTALPSLLTTLAGAVAGRGVGAVAARKITEEATRRFVASTGMAAGAGAAAVGLEAGSIFPEAVKEGVDSPVGRAIAGGVAAGALDILPQFYLLRRLGMLGSAARGVPGGRLANAAVEGGKSALFEGLTEGAQTGIERLAAGQNLTDAEAIESYINAGLIGGIAGGTIGGGVGAITGSTPAATPSPVPQAEPTITPESTVPNLSTVVSDLGTEPSAFAQQQPVIPAAFDAATQAALAAQEEAAAAQLVTEHARLTEVRDEAAAQVQAFQEELAKPASERQGRTKQSITKDLMAARKRLEEAETPLRAVTQQIADRETAARLAVPKTPLTSGVVLPTEQPATTFPDERTQQIAASEAPGFARTAEELVRLRGDAGLEIPSETPAPTPQPLVVPETTTEPRERLRQGTPQQKREAFINNSSRIVDAEIKGLIDQQVIKESAGTKAATQIKRALEEVVTAPDVPSAKAKLEEAVASALKGRLNKTDAATFSEELFTKLGQQPREFLSQGAVAAPRVDSIESFPFGPSRIKPKVIAEGKPLYRETDESGLDDLLRLENQFDFQNIFVADNPDIALGQGKNKGIQVEFRPNSLSGKEHAKPGTGDLAGREYLVDVVAPRAVQSVTFPKGFNFKRLRWLTRVALSRMQKEQLPDGRVRYFRDAALNSRTAVDLTESKQAELGRQVVEEIRRIVGDVSDLEVRLFVQRDPNSFAGRYRTGPIKDFIEIALNAKDVLSTGFHEAWHRIEEKHLSGKERIILRRGFKKGGDLFNRVMEAARRYDAANNTNIADEIDTVPQEARAYGFEMWKRGELEVGGPIRRVFTKIKQLLERIRNYLDGLGFTSVEDIYRAVDMGQFARDGANPLMAVDSTNAYSLVDETDLVSTYLSVAGTGTRFPRVDSIDRFPIGPSSIKPRVIAEGKPLYREMDIDGLDDLLRLENQFDYQDIFVADNPDIALGQGKNKGIQVEFRPNSLSGKENVKPGTGDLAGREYRVDVVAPRAVQSVTFPKGFKFKQLRGLTRVALGRMQKEELPDGRVRYFRNAAEFFSRSALSESISDIARRAQAGELEATQTIALMAKAIDGLQLPKSTYKNLVGANSEAFMGKLTRAYLTHISSGMNLARQSGGFKNVFNVITAYEQRKNRLIAEGVDVKLSLWQDRKTTQQNIEKVSRALLARTVDAVRKDSPKINEILQGLDAHEREMFWQASNMIGDRLDAEFVADQRTMANALGEDTEAYQEWFENRSTQVERLKDEGYIPERRFGDHVVYATLPVKDAQGRTTNITVLREQFESQAEASLRLKQFREVLGPRAPELKIEYGFRYSAEHDASLSYQQFLDIARRLGIEVSQAEKERLAKAMISADSVRRNRIFRRKNVAGYSEDGLRVLSEFAVTMANKIAYSEFSQAIGDAQQGREVTITRQGDGAPAIAINDKTDLWAADGPNAGFYRQLTDRMTDFVLQPQHDGQWSRTARMAASMHFLGGSVAAGVVQLSALPMITIPTLSAHTSYTNAFAKVTAAFKDTALNPVLRNIAKLQDRNIPIPAIDSVPGLRDHLIRAAEDGTTLDTEIYQIMGQTRGGMLSKSRNVRRAMEAWMYPFRATEQMNRIASFIAAYKVGVENKLYGEALYKFAQKMVTDSQNRYDEANRPGLARNPIWAILFTFKSFPIFMSEAIVALHKEKPQAAVFMLLSLAVASGVNGMPFAEDLMDLVDTVAQRLFGSPFNTQRAMKNVLKNASEAIVGTDLSGLFMHGLVNELTGLSFASRVGLGNLIPGTRLGAADTDYKRTMQEMLGPVASMVIGGFNAAESITKGDFWKAARQGAPLAAQNALKGIEQWDRGYATDVGGRKLIDVSGLEAVIQSFGFTPASLAKVYDLDRIDKQTQAFYTMVQRDFSAEIVSAVRDGKPEKVQETLQAVAAWNKAHPEMPIALNPSSIRRTVAEAGLPLNQRTLLNLPRALRGSSEAYELTRGG